MQLTLLGSARGSLNWIDLGQSNGEFFGLSASFDDPRIGSTRLAWIREVFADNQYSLKWTRVWLRSGETHIFRSRDFAGQDRVFQLKAASITGYTVEFYEISVSTSNSGVDGGIYG